MAFNCSFLGFVLYSALTAVFVYEHIVDTRLYTEKKYKGFPFDSSYGGRLKFLTHIDVGLQTAFFGLSAINALFGGLICKKLFSCSAKDGKKECCGWYSRLLNTFFTSLVFPIGVFVCVTFWGLYFIDRELVYPKSLDEIIPVWVNQAIHTLPLVAVLLEQLLVQHKYPSFIKGISLTLLFTLAYGSWVLYIGYDSGKWVYPVLKTLTPTNRALFIGAQAVAVCLFYQLGAILNGQFWPVSAATVKQAAAASTSSTPAKSKAKKAN